METKISSFSMPLRSNFWGEKMGWKRGEGYPVPTDNPWTQHSRPPYHTAAFL